MIRTWFGRTLWFLAVAAVIWSALLVFVPSAKQENLFFCSANERHFFDYFCPRSVISMEHPYAEATASPFVGLVQRQDQCYPAFAVLLAALFPEDVAGAELCGIIGIAIYLFGVLLLLRRYRVPVLLPLASLLVSGQVLFSFEVGNEIFYAAGALCVFLAWHDSDRRALRVFAAFSLAVAAVMKISPALFGLAYLYSPGRRNWRGAVLSACIFIVLFLVPFAVCGGINAFVGCLENMQMNSRMYAERNIFGVYGLVVELVRISGYSEVLPIIHLPLRLLSSVFGIVLMICAFRKDEEDFSRLCLLSMGILFVPPTMMCYTVLYVVPLFIVGAFHAKGKFAKSFSLCWAASCVPLQVPLLLGSGTICFSAAAMLDLCLLLVKERFQMRGSVLPSSLGQAPRFGVEMPIRTDLDASRHGGY